MDFGYTPEQQALRRDLQDFIAENVTEDVLGELETAEEGGRGVHYRELIRKIAERNWIGISWPEEYGGQGGSRIEQYIVEEEGRFDSVTARYYHTCGIRVDGTVACWGLNDDGEASPPPGQFSWVDAGWEHTCGVRTNGTVACWGRDDYGQATPPSGRFASVSAGRLHSCGVMVDGSVTCWGKNDDGEATPP